MEPNVSQSNPSQKRRILIVEDNILNMKLLNDILKVHGYETLLSRDGAQALTLIRVHRPDLILMDIKLPEISGLAVIKSLKGDKDLQAVPVVAVTAFAMKDDEQKSRDGGCDGYLTKPISIASFLKTVEHFLPKPI